MSARTIFRSMNLIMNMNCKCYFNRVWEMGPALFTYAARNSMGPRHPSTTPWELTQRAAILTAQPASLTQDCEQSHHLTCLCPVCAALSSSTLCCSGSCPRFESRTTTYRYSFSFHLISLVLPWIPFLFLLPPDFSITPPLAP